MCGCKCVRSSGAVRLVVLGLTTMALAVAGCGGALNKAKTSNDLKAIGLAYHNYINNNTKAPDKMDDLKPLLADEPKVAQGLADGTYVFIYGVKLTDMPDGTGSTVLGYEKDAPTKGGYALFGDGSVKQVSAKEFQAAPKAKAKASGDGK